MNHVENPLKSLQRFLSAARQPRAARPAIWFAGAAAALTLLNGCSKGYNSGSYLPMTSPPAGPVTTISALNTIKNLASAIDPINGDSNPYGLAITPASYNGLDGSGNTAVLRPGDLIISDFSNRTGANIGTSLLRYTPSTNTIAHYYTEAIGSGPVAVAISGKGATWISNYQPHYSNPGDGTTSGDGNVVVITPDGTDFPAPAGIVDNNSGATFVPASNMFAGPWGQAFGQKAGSTTPYFFVANVDSNMGWVQREAFAAPAFNKLTATTIAVLPTGSNAFDPTGPQGMVYDSKTDILYVASSTDSTIWAIPNATTSAGSSTPGVAVYQGMPLNAPLGITLNPINGDLIVANQLDNNLVEVSPNPQVQGSTYGFSSKLVGTKLVDTAAVNATLGTGSALFGVVATQDSAGNLMVYFVDANTNSLDLLAK